MPASTPKTPRRGLPLAPVRALLMAAVAGGSLTGMLSAAAAPMPQGPLFDPTAKPAPTVRPASFQTAPASFQTPPAGVPVVPPPSQVPPAVPSGTPGTLPGTGLGDPVMPGVALPGPGGLTVPPESPGAPPLVPPVIKAASAILVDARTGAILYQKNARVRRPMASTTKIMTGTLMIESGRLDEKVTFSDHARATPYANLNAKPGEKFTLRELLYAVMLRSSNDSCVAVGEHLSGQAWRFAARMTQRAKELGANDTNYVTTNGLYDPKHYSTAHDLALLTRHAIQYPLFNEVVGSQEHLIQRSINWKDTLIRNHNKFLQKYEGGDGIKTGYVRQSGKCLVASATRPDGELPWRLITVVLNSPDTYGDSQRLQDWGRKNFLPVFFARKGEDMGTVQVRNGTLPGVPVVAGSDMMAIVRRDSVAGTPLHAEKVVRIWGDVSAPVRADQPAGSLTGLVNGQPVVEVPLVAVSPVSAAWTASVASMFPTSPGVLGLLLCGFLMSAAFLGPRYARTIAKSALRRRRRLAAGSGTTHLAGEG